MFENLKIRNRLGKAFRIIVTTCSIAAVLGVVMLIVTMTLYKNALNNYGFSQGDIGKALVAFTDTRSATRAIVGYDDDSLISQMSDTHDERKATFAQGNLHDPFPEVKSNDEVASIAATSTEMAETLNAVITDVGVLMEGMANGDYTIQSEHSDKYVGDFEQLLTAMRGMRDAMVHTIQMIGEASSQVSAGSMNLAESSQSMAEGATEQAGAVQQLQATITDITSNIEQSADQAQIAYDQAKQYAAEAEDSSAEMKAMVDAMARIDETSKKIGNIISEIEDIASQTNLLSLNASIEAARAGEAGRGFAVVADQIRQLAEQTTKSAVDTRDLIEGALQEIAEGNTAADHAAESIGNVVNGIQQIAESSKHISDVAKTQANAMDQAEQGVNQISEVVQSNSASAEETSATSQELSAQATSLDELVGKFILPEDTEQ